MTAIGVTNRTGAYNLSTEAHDWKRRSERLVRASGLPYTIVRPGWFDYNGPDQHRLVLLQGDTRQAGNPSDGVIARRQLAEVLVRSLSSDAAAGQNLRAGGRPPAQRPTTSMPSSPRWTRSAPSALDAARDTANMPLAEEPQRVRDDLAALGA